MDAENVNTAETKKTKKWRKRNEKVQKRVGLRAGAGEVL